jgi:hypothetical protein
MMTLEFQLLLKCSTLRPDLVCIKKLAESGPNWRLILELAQQQGVRPLLRNSLKVACWESVPVFVKTELNAFHRENAERCLFIARELLRIFDVFQKQKISVVTFKGIALAQTIYGDLSFRELCDLDLLVHENELSAAEETLKSLGYEAVVPDQKYRSAFLRYQGQYLFRLGQTGMLVDLHWELSSKGITFPLRAQDIWQRVASWSIAGRTIPTLAPEDYALLLAAHGTKEGWRFLMWVADFAEFSRYQDVDWHVLLQNAKRDDKRVRALAEIAKKRMRDSPMSRDVDDFINALATPDRWRNRMGRIIALLTTRTASDYKKMPLPRSLWSVYYLTRPFRLVVKLSEFYKRKSPR